MSAESRADSTGRKWYILLPCLPGQLGAISLINQKIESVMRLHGVLQSNGAHCLVLVPLSVATSMNAIDHSTTNVDGVRLWDVITC